MSRYIPPTLFFLLAACPLQAQDEFRPQVTPRVTATRITAPLVIDGALDDPGWAKVAVADAFTQFTPEDMVAPPDDIDVRVMVAYDDENLYLGWVATDNPKSVRASLRDRDEMFRDDYVGILLDTFGDGSWYYELFANPIGIQGDLRWTKAFGEDEGFDIVWYSEGKITPTGFQVEMAIPFSSLRFPNAPEQEWRATFWWNAPRDSRRRYTWAAIKRGNPCFPCEFGYIDGISNVSAGNPVELLPSLVGFQDAHLNGNPDLGLENNDIDGQASVGMKYSFTSNLSAEATFNPDFSQIESDEGQIDVNSTFALWYPDRRPFFQEGSDLLQTWIEAVYTRSINDPILAAKSTGRMGRTSLAYVIARDENTPILIPLEERSLFVGAGKSTSNIFRARQTFNGDNHIGALFTDRRLDGGGSGTVMGGDLSLRFLKTFTFEVQGLASHAQEPNDDALNVEIPEDETFDDGKHTVLLDDESFWGNAAYASIERSGRVWNLNLDYYDYSPTFRADNGFITRAGTREGEGWTGWVFHPNKGILVDVEPSIDFGRVWNYNGDRKDEWIRPNLWVLFKRQTEFSIGHLISREQYNGIVFDDIRVWDFNVWSAFSDPLQISFGVSPVKLIARNLETPVLGEGLIFNGSATIKPQQRLIIQPSWRYSKLDHLDGGPEIFSVYILRARTTYQITRQLSFRFIVEYYHERSVDEENPGSSGLWDAVFVLRKNRIVASLTPSSGCGLMSMSTSPLLQRFQSPICVGQASFSSV